MVRQATATSERHQTSIWILSDKVALDLPAEVILRTNEMVLDIPLHRDWGGPYLIRGGLVGSFYAGQDELAHEEKVDVVARWAKLGDVFVGIWIEVGHEFLFSFRLPKRSEEPEPVFRGLA